jgi:uncharacterized delta-60 repeat protein
MKKYTLFVLTLAFFAPVKAAPGDLDPGFDTDGKVTTVVQAGAYSRSADIAVQPDGKLIVAGTSAFLFNYFCLVRYHPTGALDTSFDGDGIVLMSLASSNPNRDQLNAAAVQPDGKILIAGTYGGQFGDEFLVVRYNSDGSLDPGFDQDGIARANFAGESAGIRAIKIQPDGKILAAGTVGFPKRVALARFNPDGTPDTGFGTNGKAVYPLFGSPYSTDIFDLALAADGGFVAAGSTVHIIQGDYSAVVAVFNPDGSLNTNFDGDGAAIVVNQTTDDFFFGVAIQPNNKIVAAGSIETYNSLDYHALVARFNPDGSLDPGFDGDGLVVTAAGPFANSGLVDLAIQNNGKIVGLGGFYGDFLLARYNPDGTLDDSLFGSGGIVSTDFSNSGDFPARLLIQPDGQIVAAGYTSMQGSYTEEFAVARYDGDPVVPTAANVSIAGRALNGRSGIGRVAVSLTDASGGVRTALTNSFGNYRFDEVPAGQTYVVAVSHRKYVFSPESRVLTVSEALENVDFSAGK